MVACWLAMNLMLSTWDFKFTVLAIPHTLMQNKKEMVTQIHRSHDQQTVKT
jgi:hypothetical protein